MILNLVADEVVVESEQVLVIVELKSRRIMADRRAIARQAKKEKKKSELAQVAYGFDCSASVVKVYSTSAQAEKVT